MAATELYYSSLFSDANLVAYYRLEDVNDAKGSRTLTNTNAVTFAAAQFNNGGVFTAASTNKLARATDDYGIAGNGDLSLSLWVKIASAPGSGAAYCLATIRSQLTADRYIALKYYNNTGTLQLFIDNSGDSAAYNTDLGTSAFHHIVLVRVGTTGLKLYLDGADTNTTVAQSTGPAGASDFTLGNDTATQYMNGVLDDVALFNDQLTAAEVKNIYEGNEGAFLLNFI